MYLNVYSGKKVLVTGHTGFKGAWLSQWLLKLGAQVIGYSKDVPTNPSLFEILHLEERIKHNIGDVRDLENFKRIVIREKPDFIFHLAAQAIVSNSYNDPTGTISTNVLGTMNVLETICELEHHCVVVMITSDKCYENVEWLWGYKETDQLGGKDIYSGSKGAAELVIHSYIESFLKAKSNISIGIGRAGNVIGGGDWAKDRIVVDAVKAWSGNSSVEIRCPSATRPWQHVLEPLSGYLCLGAALSQGAEVNYEAFNFGPSTPETHRVIDLLQSMFDLWSSESKSGFTPYIITDELPFHEAGLLKLNCDKARFYLKWSSVLNYKETVDYLVSWYKAYFEGELNMIQLTDNQIEIYQEKLMASLS